MKEVSIKVDLDYIIGELSTIEKKELIEKLIGLLTLDEIIALLKESWENDEIIRKIVEK